MDRNIPATKGKKQLLLSCATSANNSGKISTFKVDMKKKLYYCGQNNIQNGNKDEKR